MNPWGYKNYLDSVRHDMKFGMGEMGLNLLQSFGYAHNELALRLEEFPGELPLALIALAKIKGVRLTAVPLTRT